jgi:hypothetical protein
MKSRFTLVFAVLISTIPLAAGCGGSSDRTAGSDNALSIAKTNSDEIAKAQATDLGDSKFDLLTPTAQKIMKASHYWFGQQDKDKRYPQPHMCASNVSKVFFMSEITQYNEEGVRVLMSVVAKQGAEVFVMPQDKAGFIKKLATLHGGHIPAGTLVAGENVHSAKPGDQHVGFIGHEDDDGTVWAYHNNWYRPENEKGQRKPFMVSDDNLKRGFLRQWMAVPWVKLTRDKAGHVTNVDYLIPTIDDLDPFNPDYQVTLSIPSEIAQELKDNKLVSNAAAAPSAGAVAGASTATPPPPAPESLPGAAPEPTEGDDDDDDTKSGPIPQ